MWGPTKVEKLRTSVQLAQSDPLIKVCLVEHADVAFRYETARIRIVALFIVGRSWRAVVGGIQIINGNLEKETIGS